jgi:hypothetical protein
MNMNRSAIILTIINLVLLVFLLVWGRTELAQPGSDVLRAEAIELVGEDGEVRARLNVEPSGEVVFRLLDQEGTIRVKLGASQTGSGLVLLNELTQPGIQLLANEEETVLSLVKQDGTEQVIEP